MDLESIIGGIKEELEEVEKRREKLIRESRSVLLYVRRAISATHEGRVEDSKAYIKKAGSILKELRELAGSDLKKQISLAEGEYVEALCLTKLLEEEELAKPEELGVQISSYLHGVLDCIGELRRYVLDRLRNGEFEKAEKFFKIMESIYVMFLPLSIYDNIVQGLKHKIDVARIQVEETRKIITEESILRRLMNK